MAYPNLNQYKLKVKVNNNDDTRLWRYNQPHDFDALCSFITTTWHTDDFLAQYEDDEGDFITIASVQDLKDAFDFAVQEKKKSLKIFVRPTVQRAQATQQPALASEEPEQKEEGNNEPEPKQFDSVRDMVIDFLSNGEICALLPEMFGVLVSNLIEKGDELKAEDIAAMITSQMTENARFAPITSHVLYQQYSALAIPYIAQKIALQQSLYPHFRLETIKLWITQLLAMLSQAFTQRTAPISDLVIDLQYPAMTDDGKVIHFGVECDLCGQYPIIGDRYKCSICEDWDCCPKCEPKHDHPLIKFKKSSKKHQNASYKGLSEIIKKLSGETDAKEPQEEEKEAQNVSDDKEEIVMVDVDCVCGCKMQCMEAKKAYANCNTIYCDVCSVQLFHEMYHCPKEKDPVHHQNGYDLCTKCATTKASQDEEREQEKEKEQPEPNDEVAPPKEEDAKPVEPPQPEFEYASQLTLVKQVMALKEDSDEWIKALLVEHKGDISRVVPLLLDQ
eukprot:18905_1